MCLYRNNDGEMVGLGLWHPFGNQNPGGRGQEGEEEEEEEEGFNHLGEA